MGRKRKKGFFDNFFSNLKSVGEGIGDIAECVADDMYKNFNRHAEQALKTFDNFCDGTQNTIKDIKEIGKAITSEAGDSLSNGIDFAKKSTKQFYKDHKDQINDVKETIVYFSDKLIKIVVNGAIGFYDIVKAVINYWRGDKRAYKFNIRRKSEFSYKIDNAAHVDVGIFSQSNEKLKTIEITSDEGIAEEFDQGKMYKIADYGI